MDNSQPKMGIIIVVFVNNGKSGDMGKWGKPSKIILI